MDGSNLVPIICWWLSEDTTIAAKVQQADNSPAIIPGYQITLADSYIETATNPSKTCIGVYEISVTEAVSCFYNGNPSLKSDCLIGIEVISRESNAYARETAVLIANKLQANMVVTYGGEAYDFMVTSVSRSPQYDDAGNFYRQIITIRGTIYYSI
jgi:hypothetical protein